VAAKLEDGGGFLAKVAGIAADAAPHRREWTAAAFASDICT
jgi:hypothetical protein